MKSVTQGSFGGRAGEGESLTSSRVDDQLKLVVGPSGHRAAKRQRVSDGAVGAHETANHHRGVASFVNEPWLNTDAIAAYCGGVDVSTVQRWCKENEFPHVRADKRGRILSKASWIDTWLMRSARFVEEAA